MNVAGRPPFAGIGPEPEHFVQLAVISSAAAVPAFTCLESPAQAALLEAVRGEVESAIHRYRTTDAVTFPMFANIAVAFR
jgi:hypothetical protein